ncbi:hypothetical protein ACN9MF_17990 [Methylobacterium fujisawaense]|uniref:hypothetical protein n=1 Tax=Methylobacterium fujisawaense TaxID=107400 RepID=UPI003CF7C361
MSDLFHFPAAIPVAAPTITRTPGVTQAVSERVKVPSPRTGKAIDYARLSDADHREMRDMIRALWDFRSDICAVLDEPSGLYGSRGGGKAQTFSDILKGLYDKMHLRHPVLRGRVGEDLTIKQLGELNRLIDALNAHFGGGTLQRVVVP